MGDSHANRCSSNGELAYCTRRIGSSYSQQLGKEGLVGSGVAAEKMITLY